VDALGAADVDAAEAATDGAAALAATDAAADGDPPLDEQPVTNTIAASRVKDVLYLDRIPIPPPKPGQRWARGRPKRGQSRPIVQEKRLLATLRLSSTRRPSR
jgi:hypothetical protein